VLTRPHSGRRGAAAAIALLLQLLFVGLLPVADARASAADIGSRLGVHLEQPGVHHPTHDSEDCTFCVTLQLDAVPAPPTRAPEPLRARREAPAAEQPLVVTPILPTAQLARAPPLPA